MAWNERNDPPYADCGLVGLIFLAESWEKVARAESFRKSHSSFGQIVAITGPRQSGKTTLTRSFFSDLKVAVSSVVGYIKEKSAIHIARHFMKRERNYAWQVFWARGYFVDSVGRDTETIRRYIADQEKEDQRLDQLEMPWIEAQTNANKKN